MKYKYTGSNPGTGKHKKFEFEDEYEALEFARNNAFEYPKYQVVDEGDILIDSDQLAEDDVQTALDNMFPDDDSWERFDTNKVFESD